VTEQVNLQQNMFKLWPKQTLANDCDVFKYLTLVLKSGKSESFILQTREEAS